MATKGPTGGIDAGIADFEPARDKVMRYEVKSLVKLGLPKNADNGMVAERYRQRNEG